MSVSQPLSVVFFGISGSGKGTQCEFLEKYLTDTDPSRAVIRPEMGNLARSFMQTGTSLAAHTEEILKQGALLPSFIPIYLLTGILNSSFDGSQHIILDGTCRREAQSEAVNEMMRLWKRPLLQAIVLDLSKESARARLEARGRYDDATEEALERRFAWYREHVVPAISTLEKLGWTIHHVDAEPDIDTIHQNILRVLGLSA